MEFVPFKIYSPETGVKALLPYVGYQIGEGESDHDVISKLGYSKLDVIFPDNTYEITIYEGNNHNDKDVNGVSSRNGKNRTLSLIEHS